MGKYLIGFTQRGLDWEGVPVRFADGSRRSEYIPAFDGYHMGAPQVELVVLAPDNLVEAAYQQALQEAPEDVSVFPTRMEVVAEAIFEGTNNPSKISSDTLAGYMQETISAYSGYKRSLSTGDTVSAVDYTLEGIFSPLKMELVVWDTVVCKSVGWESLDISADRNPVSADEELSASAGF